MYFWSSFIGPIFRQGDQLVLRGRVEQQQILQQLLVAAELVVHAEFQLQAEVLKKDS